MTPRRCLVRADANPEIGGGHVMRCVTLATELHSDGWDVALATGPVTKPTLAGLLPPWLIVSELAPDRLADPTALPVNQSGYDLVIVDHYDLDFRYESALRGSAKKICVIDDLASRRHDCDLLIDPALDRAAKDYVDRVSADCRILAGSAYALLRQEFARARLSLSGPRHERTPPRRLLVFMGTGDPERLALKAMDAITASGVGEEVRVFIGARSPALVDAQERAARNSKFKIFTNAGDLADHIVWADLAVGTAGTSAWERCCLALPAVTMIIGDDRYDNQRFGAEALNRSGAAVVLGRGSTLSVDDIARAIKTLVADPARLKDMAAAAARVCDGLGAPRAAIELAPGRDRTDAAVTSRPLTMADADLTFSWQTTPGLRQHFRNPAPPTAEQHERWVASRVGASSVTEVVLRDGKPAGLARLDPSEDGSFEVSILVALEHQGVGLGTEALRLLRRLVRFGVFKAEVSPVNKPSLAAFARAGYRQEGSWLVLGGPGGR